MTIKGTKFTEEHKQKIRLALMGKKNALGCKRSEEWKRKLGISRTGEKHPLWKGDKVSYKNLHRWVRNHLTKPELCQICNKKSPFDVANISGKYLRDLNDYRWLCRSCHMFSDGRIYNLKYVQ